jgi:hypothetical protein
MTTKRKSKPAKKKLVVKKIALRPGHVARVVIPPGHAPVVVQDKGVIEIAPVAKKKRGWFDWLLED